MTLQLSLGGSGVAFATDSHGIDVYAGTGALTLTSNALAVTDGAPNPRLHTTGAFTVQRNSTAFDAPFALSGFVSRFDVNAPGVAGLNQVGSLTIHAGSTQTVDWNLAGVSIAGAITATGQNIRVNQSLSTSGSPLSLTAQGASAADGIVLASGVVLSTQGAAAAPGSNTNGGAGGAITLAGGVGGVVFNTAVLDARGGAGSGTGAAGASGNLSASASGAGEINQSQATSAIRVNAANFSTQQGHIVI
jgi:hypothetical protein